MIVYLMPHDMSKDSYRVAYTGNEGVPVGFADFIEQSVNIYNLLVLNKRKVGRRFNTPDYLKWLEGVLAENRIEVVWLEFNTNTKYHITA